MKHEENIKYLRSALRLQGFGVNDQMVDQIIVTYEAIQEKGGDITLKDVVDIEIDIERKYKEKQHEQEKVHS